MNPENAHWSSNVRVWLTAAVAVIAVCFASWMLFDHFANPDALWHGVHHDRNGHFAEGLNFTLALRTLNLGTFLVDLSRAQVWPPVHGLVLAAVMLIFGPDPRLGIVPSLLGWICTIVLIWIMVSRLFSSRVTGAFAGGVAVILAIASPSFRLLSTDVMFEGLGSALSALTVYLYIRTQENPDNLAHWRRLSFVLTVLFFQKYNYWALVIVSLSIAWAVEHRLMLIGWLKQTFDVLQFRKAPARIALSPFTWTATIVGTAVAFLYSRGPTAIVLFDRTVSLYPPENLVTVTYALIFAGIATWWRHNRAAIHTQLGPVGLIIVRWHVMPVAISFLLPKRLSAFLWFIGPANAPPSSGSHPIAALFFQWPAFADGFHVASWSAALALVLALVGAIRIPPMTRGAIVIPLFTAVCALAVLCHPQQQWRFQATWMFGVWICAGVGAGFLLQQVTHRLPLAIKVGLAAAIIALFAGAHIVQRPSDFAQRVAIRASKWPSDMHIARALENLGAGTEPIGVIASFGRTPFPEWVWRAQCRCLRVVNGPWSGSTREETRALAEQWIATTPMNRVIVIGPIAENSELSGMLTPDILSGGLDAIAAQSRFKQVSTEFVPEFQTTVSLWQRTN